MSLTWPVSLKIYSHSSSSISTVCDALTIIVKLVKHCFTFRNKFHTFFATLQLHLFPKPKHFTENCVVSIHHCSKIHLIPKFSHHSDPTAHTANKSLQEYDHSVRVSYSYASGTVVTSWWESGHI